MKDLTDALTAAGIEWKQNLPLAPLSSFRIGGCAALSVFPHHREECISALSLIRQAGLSPAVFGNGTNVVFPDEGMKGVLLFTTGCRSIRIDGKTIFAEAGASLSRIAQLAREAGLSGAEFLSGIPGTLGGAVFMNAGAYGGSMEQICTFTECFRSDTGTVSRICGKEQGFSERASVFMKCPGAVILGAEIRLIEDDRERIGARMTDFARRRRETQPLEFPSAGSVFKRPAGHFAGKLIEDCGLKGMRIGGAEVSRKHAGFIINTGNATAADVRALVAQIRDTVAEKTGILLECEIRFPGQEE